MNSLRRLLLIFTASFFLISCKKSEISIWNKKLEGTWQFEKVKVKEGAFRGNVDISENYKHFELVFNPNGEVLIYNEIIGTVDTQSWRISEYSESYYDQNDVYVTRPSFSLIRTNSEGQQEVWQLGTFGKKSFNAAKFDNPETYSYWLIKKP